MADIDKDTTLPQDVYSKTLSRLLDNPAMVTTKGSTVDLVTILGHSETWVVKTVRIDDGDTLFVRRISAEGGMSIVLPPEVAAAIARQRDSLTAIKRAKAARRTLADRGGFSPAARAKAFSPEARAKARETRQKKAALRKARKARKAARKAARS